MFRFLRKKRVEEAVPEPRPEVNVAPEPEPEPAEPPRAEAPAPEKGGLFNRLRTGLARSRGALGDSLGTLLLGKKEIDESLMEALETQLLLADVGLEATEAVLERLTARVKRRALNDEDALMGELAEVLAELLGEQHRPFEIQPASPFVVLVVGVNGVGKTTTIGKLAQRFKAAGHRPLLAAGDTFRAAAVEQLKLWGTRAGVPVIAQGEGADSASVLFDAVSAARARGADLVLADTAGRLHNKGHLMEELAKVVRVLKRFDEAAPHAVLLVLDAGTGQNALAQARTFAEVAPLTGLVLTKLDGTAKGGVAFALAKQAGLPIQFVGVGEGAEDLRPFEPRSFVAALLGAEAP
ncbi:MAG: signal recognition particle-docking protein FtsY [Pseudomonadales bacterium]|nr:signal recognition particle-docking protein FtsY [Pseudomonadales bacterium]MBL6807503.1 signal recognition particle-docking protein FtsY [Pseudomonadales bacterium]